MRFHNRAEAGQKLADAVKKMGIERPVVLGIPRGGVPVAAEIARATDADLAVIVARKLGAPGNPEYAIGATTADGFCYLDPQAAVVSGASEAYIDEERGRQSREAVRREALFDSRRRPRLEGRTVIVVDDGIATGSTAIASLRSVRAAGAARVVLAVPVGPPSTIEFVKREADDVVCLAIEPNFWAVGQFYDEFEPVEDAEVLRILHSFAPVAAGDPSRAFAVGRGPVRLVGRLTTPEGTGPFPAVVFVHGLGSSKESPRNVVVAEALVDAGIAAVLFDLSGHGQSSPDPRQGTEPYVDDLEAVFHWTRCQPQLDAARVGVAGSSLGAVVALQTVAAGKIEPKSLVLRAPPLEADQLAPLSVSALVLIGSRDPLLTEVSAAAARSRNVELAVVQGAGHLFEEPGTLEEATERTVGWFVNALQRPPASAAAGPAAKRNRPPQG